MRALGRRDELTAAPEAEQAGFGGDGPAGDVGVPSESRDPVVGTGLARLERGRVRSRYAGVMLLHGYLDRVGAEAIFGSLTGGPARRYDDLAVLSTATVGFALGIDTVEGGKHLRRTEAGAVVGLVTVPELATLRARLGALTDGSDPLGLQRAFAAGMLSAGPAGDPVYFVDDHFVAYSGAQPVGKGWNTKRRHAQPGRDDTLLVDARGRVVVFGSGEPSGLSSTLPGVLTQLRRVLGPDARCCWVSTGVGPTRSRSLPAGRPAPRCCAGWGPAGGSNMFRYAAEHNGIDTLADYTMGIGTDTRKVKNPARVAARKQVVAAASVWSRPNVRYRRCWPAPAPPSR